MVWPRQKDARGENTKINYGMDTGGEKEKMTSKNLTPNSDLCHLQHKLIGFYDRDEKCLKRGTGWVFNLLAPEFGI
jgi:hypothetical protein